MLPHASAEPDIRAGFKAARVPWGACRALAIQCIAAHETAYGTWPGRKEPMPPTNWGANHCKRGEPGFKANDRHFVNGQWKAFPVCFATPATNAAGVALIIQFFVDRKLIGALDYGAPRHWVATMAHAGYFDPAGIDVYAASVSALAGEMVRTVPAYAGVRLSAGGPPPNSRQGGVIRAGFLTGPETTKSYMRQVDIQYDAFNGDMMKAWLNQPGGKEPFPKDFFGAWQKQWSTWKEYFNANIDGITTGWTGADYEETAKYDAVLADYRAKYSAYTGVKPTAPDSPKAPESPPLSASLGIPWNGILVVGGLAAAGYLLSNLPSKGK